MLGKYKAVLALLLLIILVAVDAADDARAVGSPRWRASGYRSGHVLH